MRSRYGEDVVNLQKTTLYTSIEVDLTIKDPATMLVEHKRTYEVVNTSNEPIKNVLHGIATDVDKATIDDLKVRVYDENHRNLRISSINVNKPDCKEFTTDFLEPIVKGETGRKYTLVYEVEEPERYFENAFLIDCQKLTLWFTYPQNHDIQQPILYKINQETEAKSKSNIEPTITEIQESFTPSGATDGKNDFGELGYGGPAPPDKKHTYIFKLYALDTKLDLAKGATKSQVEESMQGHILEETNLNGTYEP
jgi:hypothetical protein